MRCDGRTAVRAPDAARAEMYCLPLRMPCNVHVMVDAHD